MSDKKCYVKAFPFGKIVPGIPGPGMIEDTGKS